MSTRRDPDQLIHHFLREGSEQLHDQVYEAVRADIEQRRQRVVIGPWRMPDMNKLVPLGVGIAAVAVAAVLGIQLLPAPAPGGVGSVPRSSRPPRRPRPRRPRRPRRPPTPSLSPSPATSPPLTQTFTSPMHGFSVSYPEGWIAQAATEPWTDGALSHTVHANPYVDVLCDPVLDDRPVPDASRRSRSADSTPEDWVAAQMAGDDRCTTTEPIIVDGATGLSGGDTCHVAVAVATAGRGYHIDLRTCHPTTATSSLRTTEHGSRRSLPPCSSSPRMPSMWRRPRRRRCVLRPRSRLPDRLIRATILIDSRAAPPAARAVPCEE